MSNQYCDILQTITRYAFPIVYIISFIGVFTIIGFYIELLLKDIINGTFQLSLRYFKSFYLTHNSLFKATFALLIVICIFVFLLFIIITVIQNPNVCFGDIDISN